MKKKTSERREEIEMGPSQLPENNKENPSKWENLIQLWRLGDKKQWTMEERSEYSAKYQ